MIGNRLSLVFALFCLVSGCFGKVNTKSIGAPVDETFIYKSGKHPKSIADSGYDVFTALKRIDQKRSQEKSNLKEPNDNAAVFALRTVNGDDITNIDVLNVIKLTFLFSGKKYDPAIAKLMAPAVLDSFEDDKLRQQCAAVFGIVVTKADIDSRVEEIAKGNGFSVEEMAEKFREFGISMKSFRANIKSKMIFQLIVQSLTESKAVSKAELSEVRALEQAKLNSKRYYVSEIFRYTEDSAKQIFDLIKQGFAFPVLAESFSQQVCQSGADNAKWVREESLEPEVLEKIKGLNPGECSEVIKTKAGYKIVLLLDKAEPGKTGSFDADYEVLQAKFKYNGKLYTQQDLQKSEDLLKKFMEVSSVAQFEGFCKEHDIEFEKSTLTSPNQYYLELINRSKSSGKAAALQSLEDEDYVNVVMFISETQSNAKLPSDEELTEIAVSKKLEKEFARNFKRIKFSAYINKDNEDLERMFK